MDADAAPAVSVVIPTYNRAALIGRAVGSVLAQTAGDLELIVVDDGSTDNTAAVVRAVQDPRLIYLPQPQNLGVSAARNIGIRAARGEWVAFLDSDDRWRPQKLQRQLQDLQHSGFAGVAAYCRMCRTDGRHVIEVPQGEGGRHDGAVPWPSLLTDGLWFCQTWLVRREALLACNGFDERMHIWEDWDLLLRLSQRGAIRYLPEVLVESQVSPDSLVGRHENRPASLRLLQQKHAALFARDPAVAAHHAYTRARYELLYGDWRAGWRALAQAIRMQPLRPRGWALFAASLSGRNGLQHLAEWAKQRKAA